MRHTILLLTGAVLLAGCGAGAPAPSPKAETLDNGLTVFLRPVEGASKVALVVLYDVGNRHDPPGKSGLGHLIEHCYVTAAAGDTPARDMRAYVARYPDGWNAQTGDAYTVVATVFAPDALDRELADAAARMGDLRVTEADLAREKPRIADELANMYGRIPVLGARNLARERVCPMPNGGRRGGVTEQVAALTLADVTSRLKQYYKPAGATLALVGAIDRTSARTAVAKHFAPLPSGEAPPAPADRPEPKLPADDAVTVKSIQPNAEPTVAVAYAAPQPGDDRYAPFLMLVARMWQRAQSLGARPEQMPVGYAVLDDPDVVSLCGPARPNEAPSAAASRFEKFIAEAVADDVTAQDLLATVQSFSLPLGLMPLPDAALAQNVYGVALAVGRRAQLGVDPVALRKAIDAVTTADLKQLSSEILAKSRRAAVVVTPGG